MERLTFDGNFCDIAQCRELLTREHPDAEAANSTEKPTSCVKMQRMCGYYLVDVDGTHHRFTRLETAMQFIRDQTVEEGI